MIGEERRDERKLRILEERVDLLMDRAIHPNLKVRWKFMRV